MVFGDGLCGEGAVGCEGFPLRIKEDLQNNDNIRNIITSKFKKKLGCDKELKDKRKLRYYK